MEDIDILIRAKMYINKLANGINPLNDEEVPEDSVLNQTNIIRCLFYVDNKLGQLIDNNGVVRPARRDRSRGKLCITDEDINNFRYFRQAVSLSELLRAFATVRENMVKCTYKETAMLLQQKGILEPNTITKSPKLMASESAKEFGIFNVEGANERGKYLTVKFNREGQQLVLALLKDYAGIID